MDGEKESRESVLSACFDDDKINELSSKEILHFLTAQLPGTVEYADCIFAQG